MKCIFKNGHFITLDQTVPTATSMVVEDGIIVSLGMEAVDDGEVIDLGGKTVIPGFNDSHLHLLGFGINQTRASLHGTTSICEIVDALRVFKLKRVIGEAEWIIGRGWNQEHFITDKRFPTRDDLDEVSITNPILIFRTCGHIAVANTKALQLAGLLNDTRIDVVGGVIEVDQHERITGVLCENAISLVSAFIPPRTDEAMKGILKESMAYANSLGITSLQSDDFEMLGQGEFQRLIHLYESLASSNEMTCRVYEQCLLQTKEVLQQFIDSGYYTGYGNSFFKLGPLKLLADGSLGARTAALKQPYVDDLSTSGVLCYSDDELLEMIKLAHESKLQVAIHAIGDLAIQQCLSSIETVLKDDSNESYRHGIVHCQITDEALLKQMADLKVLAYIQPIFLNEDLHIVNQRVGEELAKTSYAFKWMIDQQIHCSLGTDCPVEEMNPFANLYCAVTRKDLNHMPSEGFNQHECLSLYEALLHYTAGGAYASFDECVKGTLSVGMYADFIVLDRHIFEIEPLELLQTKVLQTYLNGRCVYESK